METYIPFAGGGAIGAYQNLSELIRAYPSLSELIRLILIDSDLSLLASILLNPLG